MPFTLNPNARNDPNADTLNTDGSLNRDGSPSTPEHVVRNTDGSQSVSDFDPNAGNAVAQKNAAIAQAEREGAKADAFDETGMTSAQVAAKRADQAAATDKANLTAANATIAANKKAADDRAAADKKAETGGTRTSDQRLADNTANRAADNATNRAADNKTNADAAKTYDTKPV